MDAKREDLEWVPRFPEEPSLDVVAGPDDLAVKRFQDVRLGNGGDADDVSPPFDPDGTVGRGSRHGAGDPALIGGFQELSALMLDRWVQPDSSGLHAKMATVFAKPTFAKIENLLTFEEGLYYRRPFLQRGARG